MDNKDIRILYAEDDPRQGYSFVKQMEVAGYTQITHYETGIDLLEEYTRNPNKYDIIISDDQMREMDGIEVLKNIRGRKDNIPFILHSSVSDSKEAALALGGSFVSKNGWDFFTLMTQTITSLLSTPRQPRPDSRPGPA